MQIKKRDGRLETIKLDKISKRIQQMSYKLHKTVDPMKVAIKTIEGIYDGVTSVELDNLAAEISASMSTIHPDYSILAARIAVSSLHKDTSDSFVDAAKQLFNYVNPRNQKHSPLITEKLLDIIVTNADRLEAVINKNNDFNYDYFGFKTLERSYLLKCNGKIVERPQYMLMRVSLGIHEYDLDEAIATYNMMSTKIFTHATPTLFNSGTLKPQMSSCFLLDMKDDSIDGIYDTLKQTALISQSAGGIGIAVHKIRAAGSYIAGTNGTSNGLVPMLKVFNDTAKYVDQGGGKRKGSFAIYIEPWHSDIFEVLDLKKNTGKEEMRARDLFYAMWNNDLFMNRVKSDSNWTLMCPHECPGLDEVYGYEFEALYQSYEEQDKGKRTIKARLLWDKILESQIETGTPYMLYKDAANRKSNQSNIGIIRSSNLCFTGDTMVAVADGRNAISIKQLSEESNKLHKFPVYSARTSKSIKTNWKTEIKNAIAFKTGTQKVIEIILSNGTSFKCTPDHELATNIADKYVKAIDSKGIQLQEFFTYTPIVGQSSYRHINSLTNGYAKQHIMLYDFMNPMTNAKGYHVDHISNSEDFPDVIENLQLLKKSEHLNKTGIEISGKNNPVHKLLDTKIHKHNQSISMIGQKNGRYNGISNEELINHGIKIINQYGSLTWKNYCLYATNTGIVLPKSFSKFRFNGSFSDYSKYCIDESLVYIEPKEIQKIQYATDTIDVLRSQEIEDSHRNVFVIDIIDNNEIEDVYDLTVEDNANFYIVTGTSDDKYLNCQGILVHNCTEIMEHTSPEEVAVCNLASISLPAFIRPNKTIDYQELQTVTRQITRNINKIIDVNYYPVKEGKTSNMKHRPIGIGVQGLADVFAILHIPFESEEAKEINRLIFENIYFASLTESNELAKKYGSYETFKGSPASFGKLQFDLWENFDYAYLSENLDWLSLKESIVENGLRNSLLIAPMPTASTSQILGNNEAFEPFTSNMYTRRTLSGEFIITNKYLMNKLIELDLWNDTIRQKLMKANGSVQNIPEIPTDVKEVYKTVWEMSMKNIIDMSRDRGFFVDQSQSLNLFMSNVTTAKLTSMHFYAWEQGLKTGMYYLRTKAAVDAIKFTVDNNKVENIEVVDVMSTEDFAAMIERSRNAEPDDCEMCGS